MRKLFAYFAAVNIYKYINKNNQIDFFRTEYYIYTNYFWTHKKEIGNLL